MGNMIGTRNEKPLHAALKRRFAKPGDVLEAPVRQYTVDILRGRRIIEIQTANFSAIRRKLGELVRAHPVHLVHPIANLRWILKQSCPDDHAPTRRKSPKRGVVTDLFVEFVSIPELLGHRNFTLEVLLTEEEQLRRPDARRGRRRNGWVVAERRLVGVLESHRFRTPRDLLRLVPADLLPDPFSTADLSAALGRPRGLAQKAAYCLSRAGAIHLVGKRGNARLYSLTADAQAA